MNVINFSGGRTSAYMAKRLIDEGLQDYFVVFQNTGKESPETYDFIEKCSLNWGIPIIWLEYRSGRNYEVVDYYTASRDGRPFDDVIADNGGTLPNTFMRFCTREMKVNTLKRWCNSQGITEWAHYVGIRYDEPRRWGKASAFPKYMDIEHPLVKWKVTKQDVIEWWSRQPFDLQVKEPYGNCDMCFLKGKGKLATIIREQPELANWWIEKEKQTGNTFKKEISYEELKHRTLAQGQLFDGDPSFECFCNID